MANPKKEDKQKRRPPAKTPEAREDQLVALAINLAEQQLSEGTASSQVMTHFLKLGSTKDRIEKELLEEKKKVLKAKVEAMESAKRVEQLYTKALDAMKDYSGKGDDDSYD